MTRFIGIVSAKGGVGKTTTSINLSIALHEFKQNILLIDANTSTPSVGISLGAPIVDLGLNDILKKGDIEDAVHYHDSGLKVIPSRLELKERSASNLRNFKKFFNKINGMVDIALFDSAAGVTEEASLIMDLVDELIVVTTPDPQSVTAALKSVKIAEEIGKDITGIVLTRSNNSYDMPKSQIESMMGYPVIGVIPEDSNIRFAANKQNAAIHLYPRAPSSIAYRNLAAHLIDEPFYEAVPKNGMFKRIVKAIKDE